MMWLLKIYLLLGPRSMRTKLLKLALAMTLSSAALTANAAPDTTSIVVDGITYNVSTIATSWDASSELLQSSSPWWGNGMPARTASAQLAGTYFAYSFDSATSDVYYFYEGGFNSPLGQGSPTIRSSDIASYAFISTAPVPEADTSAMLLMGAGVMGFMARRRKQVTA